jgi:hypothetical protein
MLRRSNEVWKRITGPKKRVQLGNPKGRGMGCGKMGRFCNELASDVADDEGHARDAGEESNVETGDFYTLIHAYPYPDQPYPSRSC